MHTTIAPRRISIRTLSRIAIVLILMTLLITEGMLAARQFDTWYLAGSIAREDDRVRCPIDLASFPAGAPEQTC